MCTISIFTEGQNCHVFMNRDEVPSRGESQPGWHDDGLLYPVDEEQGGTWIAANKFNYWGCLLNAYPNTTSPDTKLAEKKYISRGEILREILKEENPESHLKTIEFTKYRPFRIILGKNSKFKSYLWDGSKFAEVAINQISENLYFATSSSFNAQEVKEYRLLQIEHWLNNGQIFEKGFPSFHLDSKDPFPAHRIFVKRKNAVSKSTTGIIISESPNLPEMTYLALKE